MELVQLAASLLKLASYLIALHVCWYIYRRIHFYLWKIPPGPLGLPFFGYYPFIGKEPHKTFHRLSKEYGPLFSLSFASRFTVVVTDYEYVKELYSHPAALARPDNFFDVLPGNGGFAGMLGEPWKEQRRFCIHTMRNLGIRKSHWENVIQEDVSEFVECLQKRKGKPVDISWPLTCSATSSIASFVMGRRFTQSEASQEDLQTLGRVHHLISECLAPSSPLSMSPSLFKYLVKFNIAGYRAKNLMLGKLHDVYRREVIKHQDFADQTDPDDFVGYYLEAFKKKGAKDGNSNYSVKNLIGNMAALFFGGSDTVIASVHWLTLLMAAHPEIQRKAQLEIDDVIGKEGQATWDDRRKLPYTMATMFEMQRWAVVVPIYIPKCATETIEFRGYTIPKGTIILGNSWSIHRDPKLWDNPDEFIPERFLQPDGKAVREPGEVRGYAPFSLGKRNCPGETMGSINMFVYFTRLMQKFTIKPPPGVRVHFNAYQNAILHPESQELCFIER